MLLNCAPELLHITPAQAFHGVANETAVDAAWLSMWGVGPGPAPKLLAAAGSGQGASAAAAALHSPAAAAAGPAIAAAAGSRGSPASSEIYGPGGWILPLVGVEGMEAVLQLSLGYGMLACALATLAPPLLLWHLWSIYRRHAGQRCGPAPQMLLQS